MYQVKENPAPSGFAGRDGVHLSTVRTEAEFGCRERAASTKCSPPLWSGLVVGTRASRPQPLRGRLRRALTRYARDKATGDRVKSSSVSKAYQTGQPGEHWEPEGLPAGRRVLINSPDARELYDLVSWRSDFERAARQFDLLYRLLGGVDADDAIGWAADDPDAFMTQMALFAAAVVSYGRPFHKDARSRQMRRKDVEAAVAGQANASVLLTWHDWLIGARDKHFAHSGSAVESLQVAAVIDEVGNPLAVFAPMLPLGGIPSREVRACRTLARVVESDLRVRERQTGERIHTWLAADHERTLQLPDLETRLGDARHVNRQRARNQR